MPVRGEERVGPRVSERWTLEGEAEADADGDLKSAEEFAVAR